MGTLVNKNILVAFGGGGRGLNPIPSMGLSMRKTGKIHPSPQAGITP